MTTLAHSEIKAAMDRGKLIRDGTVTQVGPACYELRMGKIYYDLTEKISGLMLRVGAARLAAILAGESPVSRGVQSLL
jgi:dCTP deaminase